MSQPPDLPNPLDPFGAFKGMRDTYMDTWSKLMIDTVSSEAYAQAMGQWLDSYLTMSAPLRKTMETSTTRVLEQLNMPTRSDVTRLAERLTNVEMRLDDLDAKLDAIFKAVQQPSSQSSAGRQSRGKKEE